MALTARLAMGQMDSFIFAKFVSSMLGCMLFAYTFATLRNRQRDELILLSSKDGLTGASLLTRYESCGGHPCKSGK